MLLAEGVLRLGPARRGARAARATLILLALAPPSAAAVEFDEFPDDPSAWTTVIDARDFDERFASVADALERAPGVDVRRFGGLGSYSTASVRGSKPEQVLVLLDGVRLDSGPRGAVDLSTIPLRTVERIEIVRGGGAGRYGSDAVGGVIAITSRRPDDEVALDASGTTGELGTLAADLLATGGRGRVSGLAGYTRLSGDNDFRFERSFEQVAGVPQRIRDLPAETFTRRNADFEQDTGLARLLVDTGELSDLEATLELHDSERGQPGTLYGNPTPVGLTDEEVSCPHPSEDFRRTLAALDWGHASVAGGGLALAAFHRVEQSGLTDPGGLCGLIVGRDGDRVEGTQAETGTEARWTSELFAVGPVGLRSRLVTGLRRDHLRSDDTPSAERFTTNLFLQQEIRLLRGALRVFPSVGLDVAHMPGVTTREPGTGAALEVSPSDGAEWVPKLGAIATLAPGLRVKANLGRAFRRPSFRELFQPDWEYVRGNPELEPEDGTNFDAGVEIRPPDLGPVSRLSLEAVWFHADLDESIEFVQESALIVEPQNVGRSRTQGWELAAAATLLERLDLAASYTFTDSAIDTTRAFGQPHDPPLPNRPRNRLHGRAAVRLPAGSAWLETRFEDEFTLQDTGWLAVPRGVWQVDLGVSVALAKLPALERLPGGLELSSEWLNVGDAQRIDSLGLPLPGRVWYLRLRSRFGAAAAD